MASFLGKMRLCFWGHAAMNDGYRICIVGAGAGGLSMARALRRKGVAYDQFERHADVGGVWDQANPGSPMYDSAHMISSKTMSALMGFPMPADYPDYPGHRQVASYLRAFAAAYDLKRSITFSTSVESVKKVGSDWQVQLSDGTTRRYDGVIAATGLAWHPRLPTYPGSFAGEMMHSSHYRTPDIFKGKKVLVVGAGNSGVDIASDAARSAERAMLSMRRAYHFIPKHIFGMPADVFALTGSILPMKLQQWTLAIVLRLLNGDVTRHGLRRPDHLPLSSHPIVNTSALLAMAHGDLTPKPDVLRFDGRTVHFKDGTSEEVDIVVAATGYVHKIPFADPALLANESHESDLFLRTISRRDPTFAAIGFIEINGGVFPFYDEFADILAEFHRERQALSPMATVFVDIVRSGLYDVSGSIDYVDSPRHKVYANVLASMKALKKLRRRMGWKAPRAEDMRPDAKALTAGAMAFQPAE